MPPFDREAALKTAEKALRQGRIDAAITEYLRVVEAQPRDWNSANALGDLYVRANQIDKGVAQYTRIADRLAAEGFYPKAAALYKKILKVKSGDEYALLQTGEIAAKQGLLADAKNAFKTVAEARRNRGDKKGAAEISIRLGTLDPEDLEARLGAARSAAEIGQQNVAVREFREVASKLDENGRTSEALTVLALAYELDPEDADIRARLLDGYLAGGEIDEARRLASGAVDLKRIAGALDAAGRRDEMLDVLREVARLDPEDLAARAQLAHAYAAKGDLDAAREYLSAETAGTSAPLWLTLAEIELAAGRLDEGRTAVERALALDPAAHETAVALGCQVGETSPDAGYACLDAAVDYSLRQDDYAAAAAALHEFVTRVRHHVVALMRLVEVCVDGGLEATMYEAQAQLADAYLEVGRGLEARIISEDLVAREPWSAANLERFRRALVMLGEADPDSVIAERLSGESPFLTTERMDLNEGVFFDDADGADLELQEPSVAMSTAAAGAESAPVALAEESIDPPPHALEHVFQQMRDEVAGRADEHVAEEQYSLAVTYRDLGMVDEAIAALQMAAESPRQCFDASSMLGHIHLELGEHLQAIEWFARAAQAPASSADAGHALLYDLAATLDTVGEHARALAIFVELEAESGGYRDVASRIDSLAKVQAKG